MNTMNKTITALVLVVTLLIVGVVYLLVSRSMTTDIPSGSTTFPTSTDDLPVASEPTQGDTFVVSTADGGQLRVKNFMRESATVKDTNNPGSYYLAGALTLGQPEPAYTVTYKEIDRSFTISLWQEPLKLTRERMEFELLQTLGITKQEICTLRHSVLVLYSVRPDLAGKNLGFSFCPGAVTL